MQKTAYEMRISDWSSDVCSSDLEEVESALKAHPAVFDAIVVGVPDDRWGQRVAAVVQARDGMAPTLAELDAHCRDYVAGYKVPRELHLVAEVLRSPSGNPAYPWADKGARRAVPVWTHDVQHPRRNNLIRTTTSTHTP